MLIWLVQLVLLQRERQGPIFFSRTLIRSGLGLLKNEGNETCQAIININVQIAPRRTLRRLTQYEIYSELEESKRAAFDESIWKIHGDSISIPETPSKHEWLDFEDFGNPKDNVNSPNIMSAEDPVDSTGKAVYNKPFTDNLIHAEIFLPHKL